MILLCFREEHEEFTFTILLLSGILFRSMTTQNALNQLQGNLSEFLFDVLFLNCLNTIAYNIHSEVFSVQVWEEELFANEKMDDK